MRGINVVKLRVVPGRGNYSVIDRKIVNHEATEVECDNGFPGIALPLEKRLTERPRASEKRMGRIC